MLNKGEKNMSAYLVVVDMQNDFVRKDGALSVDVKYQSISKSKTSDVHSLRFPTYIRMRSDLDV